MKRCVKLVVTSLMLVCLASSVLAGCGRKSGNSAAYDKMKGEVVGDAGLTDYDSNAATNETESKADTDVKFNRKIIETVSLSVQTKEFDALMGKLEEEVQTVGGYIESSAVSGNGFENTGHRYANMTLRVPADKSDEFATFVSKNSTVTNKEISTEDVTLSYVDMESRVSALETEKATLEKLLAEAKTIENVISIQDRLTDVIYEIESYKSKLRTYDNLIDFTTIRIRINEVERVDIVEKQSVWQEIGTNLKRGFENVGKGCVEFFVFIVSSIPYLIVIGVCLAIVFGVVIPYTKKVKKKKEKKDTKE